MSSVSAVPRRRPRPVWLVLACALCLMLMAVSPAMAGHGKSKPEKKGILLVAFGTSVPEARPAFDNIDAKVKAAFPDVEVRWAYTSHIIRTKVAKETGEELPSPAEALAKMMADGFTHVAVQSLHTIPGQEYHGLVETAHAFATMPKGMKRILVGYPLLSTSADMAEVADAIIATLPKERKADEAVVLMGHGTHHPADVYYAALQYYLSKRDPNVFVGTVEGHPTLDDVIAGLKAKDLKTAYLVPFMSVAGDHARNDMAGDEPDSWKSVLTEQGFKPIPVLRGTAEVDPIVDIWIEHLKGAFSHFE
ncbi:sirohydrochlorin cobaltochelatase [Oceanidesulfovibrio marinus]|uniref:Sirohydrochlorin cobaltochelatase n=2 Tax=Oceanidesulfovibrio marinus TaxID=370038 RepID=A0ABX6NDZ4_9BACT|nr:sirohydrochlorin cobaltochelatase [Oceanidesulfovibrio marinus]